MCRCSSYLLEALFLSFNVPSLLQFPTKQMMKGVTPPKPWEGIHSWMINIAKLSKTRVFKGVTPLKPWEGIHVWMINIPKLSKTRVFEGVTPLKPWEGSNIWTISWLGIKPWEGMHFRGVTPFEDYFICFLACQHSQHTLAAPVSTWTRHEVPNLSRWDPFWATIFAIDTPVQIKINPIDPWNDHIC